MALAQDLHGYLATTQLCADLDANDLRGAIELIYG